MAAPPDDTPIRRSRDALAFLHAALPPSVGATVTKVEWAAARMDPAASPLARFDPLRCDSSREWGVTVTYSGPEGEYTEVTLDRLLDKATRQAAAQFLAWRFAAGAAAAKPPKQASPGAAKPAPAKRKRPAG